MARKRANRRRTPARRAKKPSFWQRLPKSPEFPQISWGLLGNVVFLAFFSLLTYSGTLWLMDRPINSVRIEGRFERVTAVQVEAAMSPYLEEGFLSLDIDDVQDAVERLPWVERASIRRSWPAALSIDLVEEQAAARWGENGLLNVYGELFVREAKHVPAELPRLSGPDGTQLQVAKRFFELNARLQQRGLTAVSLGLDARGSWDLGLSNGVQVRLGAIAVDDRAARFFVALDTVVAPLSEQVNYVDMRYTNGFAVGWKKNAGSRVSAADLARCATRRDERVGPEWLVRPRRNSSSRSTSARPKSWRSLVKRRTTANSK